MRHISDIHLTRSALGRFYGRTRAPDNCSDINLHVQWYIGVHFCDRAVRRAYAIYIDTVTFCVLCNSMAGSVTYPRDIDCCKRAQSICFVAVAVVTVIVIVGQKSIFPPILLRLIEVWCVLWVCVCVCVWVWWRCCFQYPNQFSIMCRSVHAADDVAENEKR